MKAQSLSININGPCDIACPFCIAQMTWKPENSGNEALLRKLPKALKYAKYHGVDTVLITGKGEPTLNQEILFDIISAINKEEIPIIELQTNGTVLAHDLSFIKRLASEGVNTIAVSISSPSFDNNCEITNIREELRFNYFDLIRQIAAQNIIPRISLNLTKDCEGLLDEDSLVDWCQQLFSAGAKQLTFHELGFPSFNGATQINTDTAKKVISWIKENKLPSFEVENLKKMIQNEDKLLRTMSFGVGIYDFCNLSVCINDCMTDTHKEDEIRSLILQPDGFCYHSWSFKGSILL